MTRETHAHKKKNQSKTKNEINNNNQTKPAKKKNRPWKQQLPQINLVRRSLTQPLDWLLLFLDRHRRDTAASKKEKKKRKRRKKKKKKGASMHPSRDTAGSSSPCVLQPGRAAGAPQPRRAIRANRVQTGGLPGLCSLLLEACAIVHKIVVCPLISPLVLREGGRWCCRRRRRWICGVWSPLYASVRISIQRQKQTGRERERERVRVEGGREEGGVVEKERRRRRRGWGNKSPCVRRSQWKKRGMREKG